MRGTAAVTVAVTIVNGSGFDVTGSITLQEARLRVPAANQSPSEWEYSSLEVSPSSAQPLVLPAPYSEVTIQYTFSGLPQHVALGVLETKYDMPLVSEGYPTPGNNGTNGGWEAWEWQYVVDSQPVGLQAVPWTDFLQYTCRWAYGAAGTVTTAYNVTFGMHYSNRSPWHRLCYGPNQFIKYHHWNNTEQQWQLKLGNFTLNMDENPWVYMQCVDFASLLNAAMNSHGIDGSIHIMEATLPEFESPVNFVTTELCRAGFDSSDLQNYSQFSFGYHCTPTVSGPRYDGSSSYDQNLSGGAHMNPVATWPMPAYWQTIIGSDAYGLVYGTQLKPAPPAELLPMLTVITAARPWNKATGG